MSISKASELIGSSPLGFEDAARQIVARADRTLRGVTGLRVLEKRIKVVEGQMAEYRVRIELAFDLAPETDLHW